MSFLFIVCNIWEYIGLLDITIAWTHILCVSRFNGAGFVDIFTAQIHSENDYKIQ